MKILCLAYLAEYCLHVCLYAFFKKHIQILAQSKIFFTVKYTLSHGIVKLTQNFLSLKYISFKPECQMEASVALHVA